MIIRLSAPSKTFLVGEYAVLAGGPALLLNTGPRFQLTATRGQRGIFGIPPGSPAAKWLDPRTTLLDDWKVEFHDPHSGQGGFGASSAQFLFVHAFTMFLEISVRRALDGMDREAMYNDFQVLTGGEASGADLMGQSVGCVARVERSYAEPQSWPFPALNFAILRTQNKVATHAHLRQLNREPLHQLLAPVHNAIESFVSPRPERFVEYVKAYGRVLRDLSLQSAATLNLIESLSAQSWCLAAKGCGAMGADTVLVLFTRQDTAHALEYFGKEKLKCVSTADDLSPGLEMNWSWGGM